MELLFELGNSRQVLKIEKEDLGSFIRSNLPSTSSHSPGLIPFDDCPRVKGNFIMQKWSQQWKCFVDVEKDEIFDGDRITVVECAFDVSSFIICS